MSPAGEPAADLLDVLHGQGGDEEDGIVVGAEHGHHRATVVHWEWSNPGLDQGIMHLGAVSMSTRSQKILQDLGPREAITEAVSILMIQHEVSEETALDMLVRSASESRVKIRETASRIVAEDVRRPRSKRA